jgi:hypothetical protein
MQFREKMQTEAYRLLYRKRSEVAEFPNASALARSYPPLLSKTGPGILT